MKQGYCERKLQKYIFIYMYKPESLQLFTTYKTIKWDSALDCLQRGILYYKKKS